MKFTVQKSDIVDALAKLQRVVAARSTMPILSNVLIEAFKDGDKSGLVLTSTDMDVFMRVRIPASVDAVGAVTLPARRLFAVLKEAVSESIAFDVSDRSAASITTGDSAYKILGLSAEEFIKWPESAESQTVTLKQETIRELLVQTKFAASNDETRYVLCGILLRFDVGEVTAVGTDGRRLATVTAKQIIEGSTLKADLIIPSASLEHLLSILEGEVDVVVDIGKNSNVQFTVGDVKLFTKLIDGTFPNFKQVIPTECKERVVVNREQFVASLRRASLMASAKSPSVKLDFNKNRLVISSTTAEVGEAKEDLAVTFPGKQVVLGVNPSYLTDALSSIKPEEVVLELQDELSPIVVKTLEGGFLYVVMPVRLG